MTHAQLGSTVLVMRTDDAPWWHAQQAGLAEAAQEDPSFAEHLLSAEILALLDEVETTFAETGADTPGWPDPHLRPDGTERDSREEEYSRCLEPGKYRILWSRAEAWARVLTRRGWASETVHEDPGQVAWEPRPRVAPQRTTVLEPHRPGAERLVLARTAPEDAPGSTDLRSGEAMLPGLLLGIGDPAVTVETLPDCGCDACDDGSASQLEQLDRALLSIVDGSLEVVMTSSGCSQRTSFGAESGGASVEGGASVHVTAGPWAEEWTPRPLCPPIDPHESAWAEEMLREPWPARLLGAVLGALPPPLVSRLGRRRPSRAGQATLYARLPEEDQPVTAPRDALENPPPGYRRFRRSAVLTGMDFAQAAAAVRTWALHRRAGLQVSATHTPPQVGTEVRLRIGPRPFSVIAPCRVLWLIDEPDRAGFAYGTLPGHPESGIEQFVVSRTPTGPVQLHLDAVSRPATWYARLGAPVARLVQELLTRRYLHALTTRWPARKAPPLGKPRRRDG